MGIPDAFEVLSRLLRQYQSTGRTVELIDVTTDRSSLVATVDVSLPLCPGDGADAAVAPRAATVGADGTLRVELAPRAIPDATDTPESVSVSEVDARVSDGAVVVTIDHAIGLTGEDATRSGSGETPANGDGPPAGEGGTDHGLIESGNDETDTLAAELADARNEDVPPYEDTEYLQCLYDSCDTFQEMCEHMEMDVASETVRRYMIDAGIHVPTSYDTGGDEVPDGPSRNPADDRESDAVSRVEEAGDDIPDRQLVTDGIGLPEHLRIEDVVDAVVDSMTLYEVQRALDLERAATRELLEQLQLLDLVMRRVSGNPEQSPDYETVTRRIRQCTAGSA